MWSSWPCVSTTPDDVIETVLDVAEIGQDEVDAGLVLLGEEHAAVDDQQLAVDLEDGHVPPDLAQATERHDAQGARLELGRQGVEHRIGDPNGRIGHELITFLELPSALAQIGADGIEFRFRRSHKWQPDNGVRQDSLPG